MILNSNRLLFILRTGGHNFKYPDDRGIFFRYIYNHNYWNLDGKKALSWCPYQHKRSLPITRSSEYFTKTMDYVRSKELNQFNGITIAAANF